MKRPNQDQLRQLVMLRQYNKVMEYLSDAEMEYLNRLVSEPDEVTIRQIQGSLAVIQALKQHILRDGVR